jgi:chromodomain-helicase-DNA-binding protein 4
VKWKELSYEECTWESESNISNFRAEIERFNEIQSRRKNSGDKGKSATREARKFTETPKFLPGGMWLLNHYYSYINFS